MKVRSRRQEPRWRNFAGRWTCLPAKRSPRPDERSDRRDKSDDLLEVDRTSTSDTVEGQSSNLELYPHSEEWQPVKSVTKHWCNVLVFADTNDHTSGSAAFSTVPSVAGVTPACDCSGRAVLIPASCTIIQCIAHTSIRTLTGSSEKKRFCAISLFDNELFNARLKLK